MVMSPPQEMSGSLDLVDSINRVTFDVESEQYQAVFDSNRDSPSLAVIVVVSIALEKDARALTPLCSIIDTDALDALVTELDTDQADCVRVTFCYEGMEITISGDGVIKAETEA